MVLYGQTIWLICEVTRSRELAMMDKRSSMVTVSSGIAAPVADCRIADEKQETYVWALPQEEPPDVAAAQGGGAVAGW